MKKTGNVFSDEIAHVRDLARNYFIDYTNDYDDRCLTAYALLHMTADLLSAGTRDYHEIAERTYILAVRAHREYIVDQHPELVC